MILLNNFKREYQAIKPEIDSAVQRVLSSGWYILGKEVNMFEREIASFLSVRYAIGVANGLEALQISMRSLGIGCGDEVITTPLSAAATTLAIMHVGAKPIFVDVDHYGHINAALIERHITRKTKAVIPVHLYGQSCNMDSIKAICKERKLFLIEDTAQAIGATFKGNFLGTIGHAGCFSFYPTKNLGAYGDGGLIVTHDKKTAEMARQFRDYGQRGKYVHAIAGMNSRLDELQAAILRVKLRYLKKWNAKRAKIASVYRDALKNTPSVRPIPLRQYAEHANHLFVVKCMNRKVVQNHLINRGIQTAVHYPMIIPKQRFMHLKQSFPVAESFAQSVLSLPIHPHLSIRDIQRISSVLRSILRVPITR